MLMHLIQEMLVSIFERSQLPKSTSEVLYLGSGLVGGEGLMGAAIAAVAFYQGTVPSGFGTDWAGSWGPLTALLAFAGLVWAMR